MALQNANSDYFKFLQKKMSAGKKEIKSNVTTTQVVPEPRKSVVVWIEIKVKFKYTFAYQRKMARLIEATPILEGDDAIKLLNEVANARYSAKKQNFLDQCKKIYAMTKW